jgi:hypothetical protein
MVHAISRVGSKTVTAGIIGCQQNPSRDPEVMLAGWADGREKSAIVIGLWHMLTQQTVPSEVAADKLRNRP